MSKQYIEQEIIPKISIQNGEILFNNKSLLKDGFSPFHNLEFISQLSYGANGIVFKVMHKILKIEQLVKLYFVENADSRDKALTESKKNSTVSMADTIARVYELGIIEEPTEIVYSIMEFVENSITLKEYLETRKRFWEILSDLCPSEKLIQSNSIFGIAFQESINIAAYFIRAIAYLIKNNLRHGDLNPGNILICNSMFSLGLLEYMEKYQECDIESDEKESLVNLIRNYYSNYEIRGSIKVSEVDEDRLAVKLIDLGASHIEPSTVEKTNQRDTWFIYSTVYQLLSPLFDELQINNVLQEFAFFREVEVKNKLIKKLEYYFPLERYSTITNGKYITLSGRKIAIEDGKILIGTSDFECSNETREELLQNKEIFSNDQVLPYVFQSEGIDKDLMFVDDKRYNGQIPYQMMAADILKIIGIINIYYGKFYHKVRIEKGDVLYEDIRNVIWDCGVLDEEGNVPNNNIILSPLFDYRFHEAANILFRKNHRGKIWSSNSLFDFVKITSKMIDLE